MKKKGATYGLFEGCMYPLANCSSTCFFSASFSSWVRGYILPLIDAGALGFNLMAWFHGQSGGRRAVAFSENTLRWWQYSNGIVFNSSSGMSCSACSICRLLMIAHSFLLVMICWTASWAVGSTVSLLIVVPSVVCLIAVLPFLAINWAFCASGLCRIIGSCDESIHPLAQSILGCVDANHGYPSITLLSPRSERKKQWLVHWVPVCRDTSV